MKITSLKQQIKNPERVSIFVDGKYSFSLSLDELVKHKLAKEQELSEAQVKKFKKISEDGKLRARSLEWLLNRPHSTREFKDYLYRKKADPELSEQLIKEFSAKKYLDDAKFAAWFIELKGRKNRSRRAIRAELLKKGITGEVLDEALAEGEIDEQAALKEIIAKKQKHSRYQNDPLKLAKYLTSQGFSYDLVKKLLAKNTPED
ncbi:RecX family transcriptional regulator [Candidatus Saccharibacteria bacterium]|jgi:regulatory protein|nr:RecX family transcriptional regulator [Candidatus Saccharibacteria bacterium]